MTPAACSTSACVSVAAGISHGLDAPRFQPLKRQMEAEHMGPLFICELKKMVDRVVEQWPPSQFVFIGIGRSPSVIIAELHARLGRNAALNLPLSKFQYVWHTKKGRLHMEKELPEAHRIKLFDYLHRSLVGLDINKKVLLIDYVHSGRTLLSVTWLLHRFFREQGWETLAAAATGEQVRRVHALGLCDSLVNAKELARCGVNLLREHAPVDEVYWKGIDDYGLSLLLVLLRSQGKWLAEYNRKLTVQDLMKYNTLPLIPNVMYQSFVKYLAEPGHTQVPDKLISEWEFFPAA